MSKFFLPFGSEPCAGFCVVAVYRLGCIYYSSIDEREYGKRDFRHGETIGCADFARNLGALGISAPVPSNGGIRVDPIWARGGCVLLSPGIQLLGPRGHECMLGLRETLSKD